MRIAYAVGDTRKKNHRAPKGARGAKARRNFRCTTDRRDRRAVDARRRTFVTQSFAAGAGAAALLAAPRLSRAQERLPRIGNCLIATDLGLVPDGDHDQTAALQRAIDIATARRVTLYLPAGRYRVSGVKLRRGTRLVGEPGQTILAAAGNRGLLHAKSARSVSLSDLVLDGGLMPIEAGRSHEALLAAEGCEGLLVEAVELRSSVQHGIFLLRSSARITATTIADCLGTGIFLNDSGGSEITHNRIERCGNGGIRIWRSRGGSDGSLVQSNLIRQIAAHDGGSGQNGNGINLFRADDVIVSGNRISDCAFSAIRANASSNCQILTNTCTRLGEVAIYAEFSFQGAVIASNLVDSAATGIAVSNFREGGRLAIVQGNLVRNLFFRERSPDKRGIGIAVEADTIVSGNIVERAPGIGIAVGWGRYMRDVSVTANLVRETAIGIGISDHVAAGQVLVAANMISGASNGAIRLMRYELPVAGDLSQPGRKLPANVVVEGNVVA